LACGMTSIPTPSPAMTAIVNVFMARRQFYRLAAASPASAVFESFVCIHFLVAAKICAPLRTTRNAVQAAGFLVRRRLIDRIPAALDPARQVSGFGVPSTGQLPTLYLPVSGIRHFLPEGGQALFWKRRESAPLPPGQHTGYHHRVVTLNQVMVGVVSGSILIVFGVVPGLFQELTEFVRNFCDSLSSQFPSSLAPP